MNEGPKVAFRGVVFVPGSEQPLRTHLLEILSGDARILRVQAPREPFDPREKLLDDGVQFFFHDCLKIARDPLI
jgi:hypothetical protein